MTQPEQEKKSDGFISSDVDLSEELDVVLLDVKKPQTALVTPDDREKDNQDSLPRSGSNISSASSLSRLRTEKAINEVKEDIETQIDLEKKAQETMKVKVSLEKLKRQVTEREALLDARMAADDDDVRSISSDVGDYGLDLKKIREVEIMLINKKQKFQLTEEEKKLRKELQATRSVFEMDKYVKLTEVREVLQDGLMNVYDKIKRSEDIARDNRTKITNVMSKVDACIRTVTGINKLKVETNLLFKNYKEHEIQLAEVAADCNQKMDHLEFKVDKISDDKKSTEGRMLRCEALSELTDERWEMMQSRVAELEQKLYKSQETLALDLNEKIGTVEIKCDAIPNQVQIALNEIKQARQDVKKKQLEVMETVMESLKKDEFRLMDLESSVRTFESLKEQTTNLSSTVLALQKNQEETNHVQYFIERSLPMLIHLQLCEGLETIAGDYYDSLKKFEWSKLQQLTNHISQNQGKQVRIKKFSDRLKHFANSLHANKIICPFEFEKGVDYWPEISYMEIKGFVDDKIIANHKRTSNLNKTVTDVKKRITSQIDRKLLESMKKEKEGFKQLMNNSAAQMLIANKGKMGASMPMQPSQPAQPLGFKRAGTLIPVLPTKTLKPPEEEELNVDESSPVEIQKKPVELLKKAMTITPEPSAERKETDFSGERPEPVGLQVVRETRIVHNVRTIKKTIESEEYRLLRNLVMTYMAEGKSEFLKQTGRWEELYDEQTEDFFEMQEKLIRMEETLMFYVNNTEKGMLQLNESVQNQQKQAKRAMISVSKLELEHQTEKDHVNQLEQEQQQARKSINVTKDSLKFLQKEQQDTRQKVDETTVKVQLNQVNNTLDEKVDYMKDLLRQSTAVDDNVKVSKRELKKRALTKKDIAEQSPMIHVQTIKEENTQGSDSFETSSLCESQLSDTMSRNQEVLDSDDSISVDSQAPKRQQLKYREKKMQNKGRSQTITEEGHLLKEETIRSDMANMSQGPMDHDKRVKQLEKKKKELRKRRQTQVVVPPDGTIPQPNTVAEQQVVKSIMKKGQSQPRPYASALTKKITKTASFEVNRPSVSNTESAIVSPKIQQDEEDSDGETIMHQQTRVIVETPSFPAPRPIASKNKTTSAPAPKPSSNFEKPRERRAGFSLTNDPTRLTATRHEMMDFVNGQITGLQDDVRTWIKTIDSKHNEMIHDKNQIILEGHRFKKKMNEEHKQFITSSKKELREEGFKMQEALFDRQDAIEDGHKKFEAALEAQKQDLQDVCLQIEAEYKEFATHRKKWKSDFALAENKQGAHVSIIENIVGACVSQNEHNTRALKMMLDAQMIDHIIQRQDVKDREKLLLLGVNPAERPGTTGSGIFRARSHFNAKGTWRQPGVSMTNTLVPKPLYSSSQTIDIPQPRRTTSPTNPIKHHSPQRQTPWRQSPERSPRDKEVQELLADTVLKVDRNCLNCSGNMTHSIRAIKTACLAYSQGRITYRNEEYHVDDLLDVKASVVAQCQKMVRENMFKTTASAGEDIRNLETEEAFIIEPLLDVHPAQKGAPVTRTLLANMAGSEKIAESVGGETQLSVECLQGLSKYQDPINKREVTLADEYQMTLGSTQTPQAQSMEQTVKLHADKKNRDILRSGNNLAAPVIKSRKGINASSGFKSPAARHSQQNKFDATRSTMPLIGASTTKDFDRFYDSNVSTHNASLPIKGGFSTLPSTALRSTDRKKELSSRKSRLVQRSGKSTDHPASDYPTGGAHGKSTTQKIKEFQRKKSSEPRRPQTQMSGSRLNSSNGEEM